VAFPEGGVLTSCGVFILDTHQGFRRTVGIWWCVHRRDSREVAGYRLLLALTTRWWLHGASRRRVREPHGGER